MLLKNFYTINYIHATEKFIVNIDLNPNHEIYKGHFPGNPVVPGVCLTQMTKEVIETITGKKLRMLTGDNLKFTAVLNPEINPNVTLTLALKIHDNGGLQADSSIADGEAKFFSFKGSFKEE
jgi:3-hydroxyacyl-[acyl-carrier-protein] dehydratase